MSSSGSGLPSASLAGRPYQSAALNALAVSFRSWTPAPRLVSVTASGKSSPPRAISSAGLAGAAGWAGAPAPGVGGGPARGKAAPAEGDQLRRFGRRGGLGRPGRHLLLGLLLLFFVEDGQGVVLGPVAVGGGGDGQPGGVAQAGGGGG